VVKTQVRLEEVPALRGVTPDQGSLVDGLRRGDVASLAIAFDRWHQRVRVLARRLLSDEAAAEDVVQDVFTLLPRAARSFRGEAGLEAFVLGIAVKRVRRHRRAALRRRRALDRLGLAEVSSRHDPERDAYRHQLGRRLAAALDELPLPQRVAFILCEVEEMTAAGAARVAGAPEATIRTRLFHARRRLRELLTPQDAP
jgi:RNA polymerase sigma-70 factor (ECF subfamily)